MWFIILLVAVSAAMGSVSVLAGLSTIAQSVRFKDTDAFAAAVIMLGVGAVFLIPLFALMVTYAR